MQMLPSEGRESSRIFPIGCEPSLYQVWRPALLQGCKRPCPVICSAGKV